MPNSPNMIEKTLRYPGSIDYLRMLRTIGYFSQEEVDVKGVKIKPIDLTAKLLFPLWKLKQGEEEFTIMRIIIEGEENGKTKKYEYTLLDRTNTATQTLSMARTTGYTCTAVANLVATNTFSRKGICPAEFVGEEESNFRFVISYLEKRGVRYNVN